MYWYHVYAWEHARAEEGVTAPGTGVTENDNWHPGAENRAWVFRRAAGALNLRGNFLAPEHFFFFKAVYSRFLLITDWNQSRNLKAGLVPPPLQPTRSPGPIWRGVSGPTEGTACRMAHPQLALNPFSGASAQEWRCPQNWAILHQWTILAVPHKPVWSRLFLIWGSLLRRLCWYQAES